MMSMTMAECRPHLCEYCNEEITPGIEVIRNMGTSWSGSEGYDIYLHEECVYDFDNEADVY